MCVREETGSQLYACKQVHTCDESGLSLFPKVYRRSIAFVSEPSESSTYSDRHDLRILAVGI